VLVILGAPTSLLAQTGEDYTVIARFEEARALEIDPKGRLYVADAGRDEIRIFDRKGGLQATLGDSGTRAGEFDAPTDLDPTNGQTLFVADGGNGRIQRFSADLQYLEAMPVGEATGSRAERRVFDDGRDGSAVQGEGRPIAVVSSDGDETFVVDGREDTVVRFDEQRRPEQLIGGGRNSPSIPQEPIALALGERGRLYVGDGGRQEVLAYDRFGTFVKRLSTPPLPELQALSMQRGRLWIVCADRVFVWRPTTGQTQEHPVHLDTSLLDAARRGQDLFLLTEGRLLRRDLW
jgi:sugar lactone lactonase YvrE